MRPTRGIKETYTHTHTVVDAAHFLDLYASKQNIKDIPDLVLTPKEAQGGEAHIDSTHF